jgi:4-hydroxy-tetrahydrodipicolinate synthase
VISVTANVAPRGMSDMVAAALRKDGAAAARIDAGLSGLHRELFVEANPIPVKWLLTQMGMIGAAVRLPLTPLAQQYRAGVASAARAAGVLP